MGTLVRTIINILIFGLLIAPVAHAADNRIIVQPLGNSSGDQSLDPLSAGFSDLLVAYLSTHDQLEVLYREDMHRLWQELGQDQSGLVATDAMRIGELLQANKLVKGGFVKTQGAFRANVHIFDIATSQLQYSLEDSSDIEHVDRLAASMAHQIADRLVNHSHKPISLPGDAQPIINTHFMKGLGYYFNGLHDHALAEFMQVLDLDPDRADARLWLGRNYTAGGEHAHARVEFERFLQDYPHHEDRDIVNKALGALRK